MPKRMKKPMRGDECPHCGATNTEAIEHADPRCVKVRWFNFKCYSCGCEAHVGPFRKIKGLEYEMLLSDEELEKVIVFENNQEKNKNSSKLKQSQPGCFSIFLLIILFFLYRMF